MAREVGSSTASIGLYYPSIRFRSDGWLKRSALWWDSIVRVVPPGWSGNDSDLVGDLERLGVAHRVDPSPYAFEVASLFASVIAQRARELRAALAVEPGDENLAYVFGNKIAPGLRDELFANGLAATADADSRIVGMHERLAHVYMTVLASRIAANDSFVPFSDTPETHLSIDSDVATVANTLLGTRDAVDVPAVHELVVEILVPDPRRLTRNDLMRLRSGRFEEARQLLRAEIESFVAGLEPESSRDPEALRIWLATWWRERFGPAMNRLEQTMDAAGVAAARDALSVRLPELPHLESVSPELQAVSVAGKAAVLVGGAAIARSRARRAAGDGTAESYLAAVRRSTAPGLVGTIRRRWNAMIGGGRRASQRGY